MKEYLTIKTHNKDLLSIKCIDVEIDISKNYFDLLFAKYTSISKSVFFYGVRPLYESKDVDALLVNYSDSAIDISNNYSCFLYKIFISSLTNSRNRMKSIWEHFEYPFLFFLTKDVENVFVANLKKTEFVLSEIANSVEGLLIIYKSFESNVLWVSKSKDVEFPLLYE